MTRKRALTSVAALAVLGMAGGSQAQVTQLFGFGDSLTDTHAFFDNVPAPVQAILPIFYPGTPNFSNGTNYFNNLTAFYKLSASQTTNYAVSGSQSGSTNATDTLFPQMPGYNQQIQSFLASGVHFTRSDLITTSLGTNDGFLLPANPTAAQVTAQAQTDANALGAGMNALYQQGGRRFVFLSSENTAVVPLVNLPAGSQPPPPSLANETALVNQQFVDAERALAPLAARGARVDVLNLSALESQVAANPAAYGFTDAVDGCAHVPACAAASKSEQDKYFFWDIHPTEAGYAIIARYIEAQQAGQTTAPAAADLMLAAGRDATAAIRSHADDNRSAPGVSVYAQGLYGSGALDDRPGATGFGYNLEGGLIGVDDRLSADTLIGGAIAYGHSNAGLNDDGGLLKLNSYTVSGYSAYALGQASASFAAAYTYGAGDGFSRPGVLSDLPSTSSPDGSSVNADLRLRYLLPLGRIAVGPVGGFDYAHVHMDGFTESGDALLTQVNGSQTIDTLTGLLGGELRAQAGALTARLDISAAGDALGTGRRFTQALTSAPLVINDIRVASEGRVYGVVSGSASYQITRNAQLYGSAESSFEGRYGEDLSVSVGAKLAF